jgi:hypothetical protein
LLYVHADGILEGEKWQEGKGSKIMFFLLDKIYTFLRQYLMGGIIMVFIPPVSIFSPSTPFASCRDYR